MREASRLETSIKLATDSGVTPIVFLHYPPVYANEMVPNIISVIKEYDVKTVFYGHLHGKTINYAFNGVHEGTKYKLISADAIDFCPYIID